MKKIKIITAVLLLIIGHLTYTNATERTFTVTDVFTSTKFRNILGWLSIPEQKGYVAIKAIIPKNSRAFKNAKHGDVYNQDDEKDNRFFNQIRYIHIKNSVGTLPKGLYHWKDDEKTNNLRATKDGQIYSINTWKPTDEVHPWKQKSISKKFIEQQEELKIEKPIIKKQVNPKKSFSRLFTNYKDILSDLVDANVTEEKFRKLDDKTKADFFKKFIEKNAGQYSEYEIEDIRIKTENKKPLNNNGFFKVLYEMTIQQILGMDEFNNSAVQTASTQYALEGFMEKPESLLNDTQTQAVQGETGSVGLYYGFFARKYFTKIQDLLRSNTVRIGYQKDTKVAYEADPTSKKLFPLLKKTEKNRYFDQVISFAVNLNPVHIKKTVTDKMKNYAKDVLFNTYELSVKSTFLNNKKTLFLTLVGGGAFMNDHKWIYDAIKNIIPFAAEKNMSIYLVIPEKQSFNNSKWLNLEEEYNEAKENQKKIDRHKPEQKQVSSSFTTVDPQIEKLKKEIKEMNSTLEYFNQNKSEYTSEIPALKKQIIEKSDELFKITGFSK